MAIGRIESGGREAILFGLPGNPVAVMVTFYAFVRDALLAMSGATAAPLLDACAPPASQPIRKKAGPHRVPARHRHARRRRRAGRCAITGSQGSGILRSMSEANGLVVLRHEQGDVAAGERGRRAAVRRPDLVRRTDEATASIAAVSPRRWP